jgi:hypothetical protein
MAFGGPIGRSGIRTALSALVWLSIVPPSLILPTEATAQAQLPGYAQAGDAFMRLTLDERVKLQVLLTAAGYWPAVPDADFSARLFNAILQFQVDNGFVPLGILNDQQMNRLIAVAGPYLNNWRFEIVRHPMTSSQIWVPMGLPRGRSNSYGPSVCEPDLWRSPHLRLLSGIHPARLISVAV